MHETASKCTESAFPSTYFWKKILVARHSNPPPADFTLRPRVDSLFIIITKLYIAHMPDGKINRKIESEAHKSIQKPIFLATKGGNPSFRRYHFRVTHFRFFLGTSFKYCHYSTAYKHMRYWLIYSLVFSYICNDYWWRRTFGCD